MNPCEILKPGLGELFTCSEHAGGYTRIRTPFLYPDGDIVDLFVKPSNGTMTVTDLGETLRWLRTQTVAGRRSLKQRQILQDVCLNHGVELFKGMLVARARDQAELAKVVLRLGQACLRAADLWFTFRTKAFESIVDEVADFLEEKSIGFARADKIPGRSGRPWVVDFHTRLPDRSALVTVLSTGSKAAARGVIEHTVALWYDLSHLKVGQQTSFISLFDDTADVWSEQDFKLVSDLSEIGRWSRTDEFEGMLRAA